MPRKFYLTTTLPYVNAPPHIGFALEMVQADILARYNRLLDREVFFNTGTDEHGLKIYRAAQKEEK
ncbi:MAG: class I tRNA ligase family protein, partial [Candidatus Colwellbacteria bacterium]|nr:class I tRNA ligase family protein [Candidatus Colwellbacteria bacterium]